MGKDRDKGSRSRREFMMNAARTVVGLEALPLAGMGITGAETAFAAPAARVCLVKSRKPIPGGPAAQAIFSSMIEAGLKNISGGENADVFLKKLFRPDDRVAIKVNNFAHRMSGVPHLAAAFCERLTESAGVTPENIVIYENSDGALKHAGYKINYKGPGVRCYGTDHSGFMAKPIKSGACNARYTKILEDCTAIVNVPSLKSHNMAGVTIALKNHYGSFENPRQYHGNDCDPFIADINSADIIRKKHRLVICNAVKALFAGGPEWTEDWTTDLNAILVSTDPVALDAVGFRMIKKLRKESGIKQLPYNPEPKQIKTAAKNGIGIADLDKIAFDQITV